VTAQAALTWDWKRVIYIGFFSDSIKFRQVSYMMYVWKEDNILSTAAGSNSILEHVCASMPKKQCANHETLLKNDVTQAHETTAPFQFKLMGRQL